jgi:misacylated tRNA(Ala) deacylase
MDLLFRTDSQARSCTAHVAAVGPGHRVATDRTVFYPTGGGQPGDIGTIFWPGGSATIVDTVKGDAPDTVVHVLAEGTEPPPIGTAVELVLDWDRRHRHMRMHTALHLLCAVVPGAVTGGQIGAERSRLDFDVPSGSLDKDTIQAGLDGLIAADHPVEAGSITDADLAARPDLVRTMSVKPPTGSGTVRTIRIGDVDYQPCGGTHVSTTAEIGAVEVLKIENKGKQNRRVVIGLRG